MSARAANPDVAVDFLKKLRPGGPWVPLDTANWLGASQVVRGHTAARRVRVICLEKCLTLMSRTAQRVRRYTRRTSTAKQSRPASAGSDNNGGAE